MPDIKGAGRLQDVVRMLGRPLVERGLWRVKVTGLSNIPADGPAILCPNHVSFIDSAFLMMVAPRRISFVGKAEYMDSWKTKVVFPALGMIPLDRTGGKASAHALEQAEAVLRRGELFGIFPEGTRSRDGLLHKGHTGAARLAVRVGCPIVPVGVIGTDRIQPPDSKMPRLFEPAQIRFGKPIKPDRYVRRGVDRYAYRQMTDEVMFEIAELCGQTYSDTYAARKSGRIEEPTADDALGTSPRGQSVSAFALANVS